MRGRSFRPVGMPYGRSVAKGCNSSLICRFPANGHTARILGCVRSDLPAVARDIGAPERSLRRAVQRGTVRAHRPGPRQVELDTGERTYLRKNWPLIAAVSEALRVERNVRLAVLFGSSARGDTGEDSDVDLLVSLVREQPLAGRNRRPAVACARSRYRCHLAGAGPRARAGAAR